jgi:DNA-binding MarR family transcriptional regulator
MYDRTYIVNTMCEQAFPPYDAPMPATSANSAASSCAGLDADLGWTLGVVFRGYLRAASAVTDDLPSGPRGYQVLAAAARHEPGSQSSLAQRLGVDRTVMTYLLDELVNAGLVERQADPSDRRSRLVVATKHGQSVLDEVDARLRQAEEHLLAGLEPADQTLLRSLLQRLAAHANELDPVTNACAVVEDIQAVEVATAISD